jgi:hypothetical protein
MAVDMRSSSVTRDSHPVGLAIGLIVVLAAVGLGAWWLLARAAHQAPVATTQPGQGAVAVSGSGLSTLASLGRPIYWAGARPQDTYELTQASDGRVYLRYLPAGTAVGSPRIFLTIGTYPVVDAYQVTRHIALQPGSVRVPAPGGAVAFYRQQLPTNVYLAYPGSAYQVEVFDPSSEETRHLVSSGEVGRVPANPSGATLPKTTAVAISPSDLAKVATRLGRPVYWAGPRPRTTYELTQPPDGRIYVRYLPAGVAVGAPQPYLTVGTYPLTNAYAATKAAAKQPGSVTVPVTGGIGFYSKMRPTSVYLAFPGVDEQIEVFDPTASIARATVGQHLIRSVS